MAPEGEWVMQCGVCEGHQALGPAFSQAGFSPVHLSASQFLPQDILCCPRLPQQLHPWGWAGWVARISRSVFTEVCLPGSVWTRNWEGWGLVKAILCA